MNNLLRFLVPPVFFAATLGVLTHSSASAAGLGRGNASHVLYVGRWTGHRPTYRTIQAAVNAAQPGDRILIARGDYHESPDSADGVRVTTPDITIEGVNRNTVIVDGTKPNAPSPCNSDPAFRTTALSFTSDTGCFSTVATGS